MGYACPVCADPQADAGHLANHLAFSALLGNADHETWLDEHAPAWEEMGESELADVVADDVEETEFPQVFEDTTGKPDSTGDPLDERSGALFDEGQDHAGHNHGHEHDHGHDHADDAHAADGIVDTSGPMDAEAEAVLEEAREMTREMLTENEDEAEDESE
ncbi:DUF5810 domain-containing protein [Natronomonas amylolytica]|uniref:DUF5810 domain-containing protein n=1 Tax=Natronomonas amylolytica TaxID=3108498 RepID=UPI00300A3FE2